MKKPIRIGIVGAGANTCERHIPGFQEIEGVSVEVVANRSAVSSQKVADAFNIPRIAHDWREVVNDPQVDAICIGTWPYMHAEVTLAALKAGKHVLTEARMAASLVEAEMMLTVGNEHPELVKQIVPSPFTLKFDATVIDLLQSGELGELREVLVEHSHGALADRTAPLSWRQDARYSGINMLTLGIYHEVVYRWLRREIEWVSAHGQVFTERRRHWETGVEESVTLPDSLYVQGELCAGCGFQYRFSGIDQGPGKNEIRLVGSNGVLRLNLAEGKLYLGRGSKEDKIQIDESTSLGWNVERDFIESIRTGKPVTLTSFEDGVAYMRFTQAVHRSICK